MSDLHEQLERAQADGRISPDDADEVRRFAAFLTECGSKPGSPGYDKKRWWAAYRKHYPEEAEQLAADIKRSRGES